MQAARSVWPAALEKLLGAAQPARAADQALRKHVHSINLDAAPHNESSPVPLCTGVATPCLPPSSSTQQQTASASLKTSTPSAPALQDLLQLTGGIDAARPSADGYNGFERALESCRQHGLEHEVLSAEEVNRRFPGYHLPADMQVGVKISSMGNTGL